jgi:rhomboid-like protein
MFAARPRADPNERPYLAWVQKHHIAGTLNQPEAMEITNVWTSLFLLGQIY